MTPLFNYLESSSKKMVQLETLLTSIPELAPESGGEGELEKCLALENFLKAHGINQLERFDVADNRVKSGIRPNLVATLAGKNADKNLWIIAHLDVVPVGELNLWQTDPWKVTEKDGIIYGRGVEDNQQGLVSGVFAMLSLINAGITPEYNVKLLFAADEEVGSAYGMKALLKNFNLFCKNDLIIIPDGGDSMGETIEIAEKNILWLKLHVKGKQAHGSRPDEGANAFLAGSDLALRLHNLEKVFDKKDSIFEPDYSTFSPTKKEANVPNVNTIPGDDVFYMDCRILPCYTINQVKTEVEKQISEVEKLYSVKIDYEVPQEAQSPATDAESEVITELSRAIRTVKGLDSILIGIGGGTVGAELRNCGFACAVWSTLDETAHQPNEYCKVENIISDAKVLAVLMAGN